MSQTWHFHGYPKCALKLVGENNFGKAPQLPIYMYNSTSNSWEMISHTTTGQYNCFRAVIK